MKFIKTCCVKHSDVVDRLRFSLENMLIGGFLKSRSALKAREASVTNVVCLGLTGL